MKVENIIQKIGYFWLPSDPSNKLAGFFTIKDGGTIKLELHGLFGSIPHEQWKWDIVLGDLEEYGKVTLVDNRYSDKKTHGYRVKYKNLIESDFAFIGAHFTAKDDLLFNDFSFRIEGLNSWVAISGINLDDSVDILNPSISYSMPEDIIIPIDDTFKLAITYQVQRTMAFHGLGAKDSAKIEQSTYLKIFSDNNLSFSDFLNFGKRIGNLLVFAINKQVSIEEITVHQEGLNVQCVDCKESGIPQDIKVYTNQILHIPNTKDIGWNDMMFRYRDIDNIDDVINSWLSMYKKIEPSLELYFSVIFSKDNYLKSQFLMLAQSLEALHSRLNTKDMFLIDRLKILCKEFINMGIYTQDEMDVFSEKIKDTRNYLTHYDKSKEDRTIDDNEYQIYINTMKWLLQIHFLKELGFEQDKIYKFLRFDQLVKIEV